MKSFLSVCVRIFLTIIILQFKAVLAQTDSLNQLWSEFSENETELIELLEDISKNPVNINSDDRNELLRIPFIAGWQVDSILNYRKEIGTFKSKRQIRNILSPEIYDLVKDFISIRPVNRYQGQLVHKSYYTIDLPGEYATGTYRGNAFYDLNKLYYSLPNNFKAGVVTHKDPGEKNYLDYYSGYLSMQYQRLQVVAGNYYFQFGEGLTFSNGFGQQKSAMVSLPFRPTRNGGFASLSSAEGNGLSGLYAEIGIGPAHIYLFYSNQRRDAQMTRDNRQIIGLDSDGYHRTDAELFKKHKVHEVSAGTAISYAFSNNFSIGAAVSTISYNPDLKFNTDYLSEKEVRRQYFKFNGSGLSQYTVSYQYRFQPLKISGEFAASDQGSPGITQSFFLDKEKIRFGIKYWYVSKNFQSPYGRVFDNAASFPQGEQGYYLSFALNPFEPVTINAYKIIKKDLWRTYFDKLPLNQDETLIEVAAKFGKLDLISRLRVKDRELLPEQENDSGNRSNSRQYITRFQMDFKPQKRIRFRTRWEYTQLTDLRERGASVFEDVIISVKENLSFSGRYLVYRTDSYNARLYEYESDLPGSFANYAVFGEGYLWYVLLKWSVTKRFSLYFKYRYNFQKYKDLLAGRIIHPDNKLDRSLRFQFKFLL